MAKSTPKTTPAQLKIDFLDEYRRLKTSKAQAARQVGTTFQQVIGWKKTDPIFAEKLELVEEEITDEIEAGIKECALTLKDKKDAVLAIYYHKGRKPQFRDNYKVQIEGQISLAELCKQGAQK